MPQEDLETNIRQLPKVHPRELLERGVAPEDLLQMGYSEEDLLAIGVERVSEVEGEIPLSPAVLSLFPSLHISLTRGFLSKKISVEGKTFLLKPVSVREIRRFSPFLFSLLDEKNRSVALQSGIVALGIVMVGGKNFLPSWPDHLGVLAQAISTWTSRVIREVAGEVLDLNLYHARCVKAVPAFADQGESRFLWKSRALDKNICGTEWPGSCNLIQDEIQLLWTFLQRLLDDWDQEEAFWNALKWVVGVHSGPAAKEMDNISKMRRERRNHLSDLLSLEAQASPVRDLVEELHKSLSGEMDEHDYEVVATEEKILQEFLEEEERIRKNEVERVQAHLPEIDMDIREVSSPGAFVIRDRYRGLKTPERNPTSSWIRDGDVLRRE